LEVLRQQLTKIKVAESDTKFCPDGQIAIDKTKKIVLDHVNNRTSEEKILTPVSLMLLDFQMPVKNGIDVIKEVQKFY